MALTPDALFLTLLDDLACAEPYLTGWQRKSADLMRANFLKKLEPPAGETRPEAAALLKFLQCDHACSRFELRPNTSLDEVLIGEFKDSVYRFLHPNGAMLFDSYSDIARKGQCGPGAAIGAAGFDFYTKLFSSDLAVTSGHLYEVYLRVSRETNVWRNAEFLRRRRFGLPTQVEGSRLSYAPKYRDIARVICVEPSLNMFFQLGLGAVLRERLRQYFGIDLSTQPSKNRALARVGSVTGDYFTIDLESASDSISKEMVLSCFPGWFVDVLLELRSPSTETGFGRRDLSILSSMGNGFTFPLQTMIFSCVVAAAARTSGVFLTHPFGDSRGDWGVFGDDIIAPTSLWVRVNRLLELLGFTVNAAKSFAEGPFRESCGADFYEGRPVRAVYLKKFSTLQERYSLLNRLTLWSATSGIRIGRTIRRLRKEVAWNPIPWYEDDSAGIKIPSSYPNRWAVNRNGSFLATPWLADTPKIRIKGRHFKLPRGAAPRWFNPAGLLASFLEGRLVNGSIGYRDDPNYRRTKRVYPSWDYAVGRSFPFGRSMFNRWETTTLLDL
jgi:hypothetical protein